MFASEVVGGGGDDGESDDRRVLEEIATAGIRYRRATRRAPGRRWRSRPGGATPEDVASAVTFGHVI